MAIIVYHGGDDGMACVDVTSVVLSRHDGFSTSLWDKIKAMYDISDTSSDKEVFDAIDDYFSGPNTCVDDNSFAPVPPNGGVRRVW